MRFAILGAGAKPQVAFEADKLARAIPLAGGIVAGIDLSFEANLADFKADIALVLGGDGAILRAARQMGSHQIPVLGVNLGRLGFLADMSIEEIEPLLGSINEGQFRITHHLMFECTISGGPFFHTFLGLNEVVVRSTPPFHMIDLSLTIDGEMVSRFLGDGVIVSSPIGSTAYCLAAGGPILSQELPAFVITPMCGHTLTHRPLVDSSNKTYSIKLEKTDGACVVVDGQELVNLHAGQVISIRRSEVEFRLVKVDDKTYYRTLREKLNWGMTPNYRVGKAEK